MPEQRGLSTAQPGVQKTHAGEKPGCFSVDSVEMTARQTKGNH